jgi:hypothetical protein
LTIRLPTGSEANWQGLGDTTVTPTLISSVPLGRVSLHGTLGFEVNADDLQRTRARYTLGGAVQMLENLALLVDVLGSSSLVDDTYSVTGPVIGISTINGVKFEGNTATGADYAIPRSDLIDVATGLKLSLGKSAIFFIGAIVPLTRDGLRAPVIPTGGIEVGF